MKNKISLDYAEDRRRPISPRLREALAKGDIKLVISSLTPMQRKYCEEYSVDMKATAACIRAGYSPTNAGKQCHILNLNPGVQAYIDHLLRSRQAKKVAIDPDYVLGRIAAIVNKDDAKDSDKLRGLELLAKHLGMFIERQELTGKDGGPIEVEQKRAQEDAQRFAEGLKGLIDRANSRTVTDDQKKVVEIV